MSSKSDEHILDGNLLSSYVFISYTLQKKIAKKIQVSREKLLMMLYNAVGSYRFV